MSTSKLKLSAHEKSVMLSRLILFLIIPTLLGAFKAYWNFPSGTCRTNHSIKFEDYKIETNKNLSFYGEKVVIFYEFIFGRYPYYKGYKEDQPVNGGTPQNCSIDEHLKIAKENITERIPKEDFDGFAIIDLEEWRPIFDQNFWGLKSVSRVVFFAMMGKNLRLYLCPTSHHFRDLCYPLERNDLYLQGFPKSVISIGKEMEFKSSKRNGNSEAGRGTV
ncbi:hypothetical protein Y032_0637g957 [Ancylostoma ceylanicum]|uniref:Hyaluronidase n=2 Tax=Ancylostoma ceylanicum TaxID=53326 RepID=A0A016WLI3_9BILA|nr:hypothetical protein Y032_0637g957 [Ancylostoma ceylanicum]